MSNGTSIDSYDYEEGRDLGQLWFERDTRRQGTTALWEEISGARPRPRFSGCSSVDQMIHELVRIFDPPSGVDLCSARAYWRKIFGPHEATQHLVVGIYDGARAELDLQVWESVREVARRWVEEHLRGGTLRSAQQFAEQYFNTWQNERPDGCNSFVDVALYMARGSDLSPSGISFDDEFQVEGVFAAGSEEFARRLIEQILLRLPCWHRGSDGREDTSPADQHAPGRAPDQVRQPRRVHLRDRNRSHAGHSAGSSPPPSLSIYQPLDEEIVNHINQRMDTLANLNSNRQDICLPLPTVRELSEWLEREYGIRHFDSPEQRWFYLQARIRRADFRKINRMTMQLYRPGMRPDRTVKLERRIFEYMARDPLAGWLVSSRRSTVVDATAFLSAIFTAVDCSGPILDAGCYTGYHAAWLARYLDVPVMGVDWTAAAISYAQQKSQGNQLCSFQCCDFARLNMPGHFDAIYSIDSLAHEVDAFVAQVDSLAQNLRTGGVLVLRHAALGELVANDQFAEMADRHQLGHHLADVVGRIDRTDDYCPRTFRNCDVFLKGALLVPEGLGYYLVSKEDGFDKYANTSSDPNSEKTRAFFRAKAQMNRQAEGSANGGE